jgi:predicted molibdopterin-dependent oxidoreductase YjgC
MTNPITDLSLADCIFVIGSNFAENHPIVSRWVLDAKQRGSAEIIVADPRRTPTSWSADIFLQLLPGTDIPLLNSMMNVIVEEGLYNARFVEDHTTGLDALIQVVKKYPPEMGEQLTRVPAELIAQAARSYATAKSAAIVYCMGVTQHTCGTDTVINCANLAMLCGQIGRPGTGVNPLRGQDNVQGACDMGALVNAFPGYQPVSDSAVRNKFALGWGCPPDQLSDKVGLTVVEMTHAAESGDLRGMLIMGENPIVGDPNAQKVKQALEKLEFLAVLEIFMSETAELADLILPAASFAEKRGTKTTTDRRVQWMERAIDPLGESLPDWKILCALADRLGLGETFPYRIEEDVFDEIRLLTPSYSGISPERIKTAPGGLPWPCPAPDHPGTPVLYTSQFNKPDGKGVMKPVEYQLPAEELSPLFPLVLTSGRVVLHYNTGEMTRRTRALRSREPELFVQVNPVTAQHYRLTPGSMAKVITKRGSALARARVTEQIPEGVVFLPFHFPETNYLTIDALDPTAKIPEYKVAACRVEPAEA